MVVSKRQFEPGRAVEVLSPSYGTGYRIGGRLVLTAAHLVAEVESDCRIRSKQSFGEVAAKVVWKAEGLDIALVELPDGIEPCEGVAFGRLPDGIGGEKLEFQMYGYPVWGRTIRGEGKSASGGRQIEGVIYLADSSPDGLLVLESMRSPEGSLDSGSDWAGSSGAAIVSDGLVIGVQRQHQNPKRPASLEATPLVGVYEDPQWCALLHKHGISSEVLIARVNQERMWPQASVPYFYPSDLGSRTFVGRKDELERLHELLQQSGRVAIVAASGMGGIGKTELAWQYVQQHKADYPGGIWWINPAERVVQVLSYGQQMRLPEAPDILPDDGQRVQWYYSRWLEAIPEGLRLLVLDDVWDYREVRSLLPTDEWYRVLLTSRERFGKPVERLELGVLKRAAAFRLLRRLVEDDERIGAEVKAARALCEWVGRLPLGIELVGRYLANSPQVKLKTLLERLEDKRLQCVALRQVPPEMPYQYHLEAAFEISWQWLDEGAKHLGELLSVFALAPIEREWVVGSLRGWGAEEIESAESALIRGSFVSFEGGQYLLHSLIRAFLAGKLERELAEVARGLRQGVAQVMVEVAKTVPETVTVGVLIRIQGVLPHLEVVAQQFTDLLEDNTEALWSMIALARAAVGQSRWQEAERWYVVCLEMVERWFGADHPDTATSLNNLAMLYRSMGRYAEAEPLLVRSLEIRDRQLGSDHLSTATSLNNLAGLYEAMGRYSEAEPLLVRSLRIRDRQLGGEHPSTATSLNNLGALYLLMGRYGEAEPLLVRSLEIRDRQLGGEHPETATSLNNLALLYRLMGRYGEAEPLYERSLEINERQFGGDHPSTAVSLWNSAVLYYEMNRVTEVKPLITRAVAIFESRLGEQHPDTIKARRWWQSIQEMDMLG